jgi:hypothetical protein
VRTGSDVLRNEPNPLCFLAFFPLKIAPIGEDVAAGVDENGGRAWRQTKEARPHNTEQDGGRKRPNPHCSPDGQIPRKHSRRLRRRLTAEPIAAPLAAYIRHNLSLWLHRQLAGKSAGGAFRSSLN